MDITNMTFTLLSGNTFPLLGFGTFRIVGLSLIHDVLNIALEAGYRSFDTAAVYQNEQSIGIALKELLPKFKLERKDIFLTSKLPPSHHGGGERTISAVQRSLKDLQTDYLDLYLIHWPGVSGIPIDNHQVPSLRAATWHTLVDLHKQGILRSIGVSNYTVRHMTELLQNDGGIKPSVNQVEWHPHYHQDDLLELCRSEGILLQAYSSLGSTGEVSVVNDFTVHMIAKRLGYSTAQILLRWAIQQQIAVIPKAITAAHIIDNIQLNFVIPDEDMTLLSNINMNHKYAWNPDRVI